MSIPTQEQQAVIDWQGQQLVVNAFAGTGKTSTLNRPGFIGAGSFKVFNLTAELGFYN